jgi:hypothetical protein
MIHDAVFGVLLTWLGFWNTGASMPASGEIVCGGALKQGGVVVCNAPEGARLSLGSVSSQAGNDGLVVFGLARDAEPELVVRAEMQGLVSQVPLTIAPRDDAFRVIEGLECDKVDARTPEQKDHAGRSWAIKQNAFATFHAGNDWKHGFARPAAGPPSSPFGPARKYIGISAETGEPCEKVSVHRGYDIATPIGTPLFAPAGGVVTLADPDLYYEGGTIFLDHGHGMVSVFMHLSDIDVAVGQTVVRGEKLGETGNTGRTTGPHLHWAVKWRNASNDERSGDFYIDPALLLDADFSFVAMPRSNQSADHARRD